jgi:hypothetical protein
MLFDMLDKKGDFNFQLNIIPLDAKLLKEMNE